MSITTSLEQAIERRLDTISQNPPLIQKKIDEHGSFLSADPLPIELSRFTPRRREQKKLNLETPRLSIEAILKDMTSPLEREVSPLLKSQTRSDSPSQEETEKSSRTSVEKTVPSKEKQSAEKPKEKAEKHSNSDKSRVKTDKRSNSSERSSPSLDKDLSRKRSEKSPESNLSKRKKKSDDASDTSPSNRKAKDSKTGQGKEEDVGHSDRALSKSREEGRVSPSTSEVKKRKIEGEKSPHTPPASPSKSSKGSHRDSSSKARVGHRENKSPSRGDAHKPDKDSKQDAAKQKEKTSEQTKGSRVKSASKTKPDHPSKDGHESSERARHSKESPEGFEQLKMEATRLKRVADNMSRPNDSHIPLDVLELYLQAGLKFLESGHLLEESQLYTQAEQMYLDTALFFEKISKYSIRELKSTPENQGYKRLAALSFKCVGTAYAKSILVSPNKLKHMRDELHQLEDKKSPNSLNPSPNSNSQPSPSSSTPMEVSPFSLQETNNHVTTNVKKLSHLKDMENLIKCFEFWKQADQSGEKLLEVPKILAHVRSNLPGQEPSS